MLLKYNNFEVEYNDEYDGYLIKKWIGEGDIIVPDSYNGKPILGFSRGFAQPKFDINEFHVSKNIIDKFFSYGECIYAEKITVDEDNKFFLSEDGVLYNKDKTELIGYSPIKKSDSFVVNKNVRVLKRYNFIKNRYLQKISFAEGSRLEKIEKESFFFMYNLKTIIIPKNTKIIEKNAATGCYFDELVFEDGTKVKL